MNKVIHGRAAWKLILGGAKTLYDAVKETYGPAGGNVGILKPFDFTITHDGVTVAKNIELGGDEKIGAEIIKKVASKMDNRLGDGTTTVTILSYSILEEADNRIMLGARPLALQKELQKDAEAALAKLPGLTHKATDKKTLTQAATISAGDGEIGKLVAETVHKLGAEANITVETGTGTTLECDIVEGYTVGKGYANPFMVTDQARQEAVLDHPSVYVTSHKIVSPEQLMPIFQKLNGKKELLIFADGIEGAALETLALNKVRGSLNALVIQGPGFGERRQALLEDIAALTGTVVEDENTPVESLGTVGKVIARKDESTLIGGVDISSYIKQLTLRLKYADENEKKFIEERLAALRGQVAVIKVGGATETEIEEKKYRVEDAVHATKAAHSDGVVPGAATTYRELAKALPEDSLLAHALNAPFNILLENSGITADTPEKFGMGYDVTKGGELIDLRENGIIDPARTIEEAIRNAVSIAGTALTMRAIVIEEEKEDKEK